MTRTAPTPPDPVEAAVASINALLASIDRSPSEAATVAFRAAIRRNGVNLRDAAGPEGLAAVLARIRAEASDKSQAEQRERIVLAAWERITASEDRAA